MFGPVQAGLMEFYCINFCHKSATKAGEKEEK
jgi:hypothetical protein